MANGTQAERAKGPSLANVTRQLVAGGNSGARVRVIAGLAAASLLSATAAVLLAVAVGRSGVGYTAAGILLVAGAAGIGFHMWGQRRGHSAGPGQRRVAEALLAGDDRGRAVTDSEGRLLAASAGYRGLLDGKVPSPLTLLPADGKENFLARLARDGKAETKLPANTERGEMRISARGAEGLSIWSLEPDAGATGADVDIRLLADALDRCGIGVLGVGSGGRIRRGNAAAAGLLKIKRRELDGKDWDIVRPSDSGKESAVEWLELPYGRGGERESRLMILYGRGEGGGDLGQALRLRNIFDDAPIGVADLDDRGRIRNANSAFYAMFAGEKEAKEEAAAFELLFPAGERQPVRNAFAATCDGKPPDNPVEAACGADGNRVIQVYFGATTGGEGSAATVFCLDTSEQRALETQFVQAQKMQAVGQLAGGIAHDFNNLLTAIIGFCDLLLLHHGPGDRAFSDLMQVKQNANRAANLVRQLLAFSRRQTLRPKVLSVTDVLAELSNLIGRLIGENIELEMVHGRDLGAVRVDQGQLEQVIINLAVNARDAMPGGGALTVTTRNVAPGEVKAFGYSLIPADEFVLITIADTGDGIADEHIEKIFEPFFTTKEVGQGTGLGLSTVYGIVKQTGGFIFAKPGVETGARFEIFLPLHKSAEKTERPARDAGDAPAKDLTGQETILLVEDEDAVRVFAARALQNKGYEVLEASSGEAALEHLGGHEGRVDLLISDIVMPNMDGPTLVEHARRDYPGLKVILISGYAEDTFRRHLESEDIRFLPKPFSLKALAEEVKETLQQ